MCVGGGLSLGPIKFDLARLLLHKLGKKRDSELFGPSFFYTEKGFFSQDFAIPDRMAVDVLLVSPLHFSAHDKKDCKKN